MAVGVIVWSETAASNANADTSVNWAEGMAPSAVNDSARAEMASVAKWRDDLNATLSASGVSTALTLTTNQVQGALTAGYEATFTTTFNIGAPATINVDSLGAKPLRRAPGVETLVDQYKLGIPIRMSYFTSNSGEWVVESHRAPSVVTQIFTSTAATTYTPTSGMAYCIVEAVGGGAGGGGIAPPNTNTATIAGGGGGAGSYARKILSATAVTSSQVVTCGAGGTASSSAAGGSGGDTTFGSLCIGKGGTGGTLGSTTAGGSPVLGGAGGVAGTGDFAPPGAPGGASMVSAALFAFSGGGGMSQYGGGGHASASLSTGAIIGSSGQNYGGGGAGGLTWGSTASAAGGVGAPGIVIVTEYV